ncbi:hypothetical protein T11_10213 [Trichinella zimbabwensis]|uniref:Uncharacterized protein n=1 Tax=Trichinella zimbabwensis TaxID=268475 RepID=A0A0V1HEP4_9BILA|nr:hypothetical protein T11_10213 [Trichinella zimbabwensis]
MEEEEEEERVEGFCQRDVINSCCVVKSRDKTEVEAETEGSKERIKEYRKSNRKKASEGQRVSLLFPDPCREEGKQLKAAISTPSQTVRQLHAIAGEKSGQPIAPTCPTSNAVNWENFTATSVTTVKNNSIH